MTSAPDPGLVHWPAMILPSVGGAQETHCHPPVSVNGLNGPGLGLRVPRSATERASSHVSLRRMNTTYLDPGREVGLSAG